MMLGSDLVSFLYMLLSSFPSTTYWRGCTDGEIYHGLGMEESILWWWLYYPSNLQIQCNPYQTNNGIFHRTKTKKNSKFVCKHKRPQRVKAILRKKKWSWRKQLSWLQIVPQSYSSQDSMVLAQKQKYRPMEEERKPRDKLTQQWVPYLWQRRQEHTIECFLTSLKLELLSRSLCGITGSPCRNTCQVDNFFAFKIQPPIKINKFI